MAQYKKIIDDMQEKLNEVSKVLQLKKKYEKEHSKDQEFEEYLEPILSNSKL